MTGGELLFLQTKQPILVAQAIAHILRGGWSRAVSAAVLAALALTLFWMLAAALGQIATVGSLLDYFHRDAVPERSGQNESKATGAVFRSVIRLSFLRVALAIAAISAIAGAAILAGFASPGPGSNPAFALLIFFFVAAIAWVAAWILNWFLSLAAVCAVRDQCDAPSAISAGVSLCRERGGAVLAVTFWTGFTHLAAFFVASSVVFTPLVLAGTLPWQVIVLAMALITLAYFAVADWIHIARIAGYVCISEMPDVPTARQGMDVTPTSGASTAAPSTESAVDRDELILGDLPNLAPQA